MSRFAFALVLAITVATLLSPGVSTASDGSGIVTVNVTRILDRPASPSDPGPIRVRLRITSGPRAGDTITYTHQLWGHPRYDPPLRVGQSFVAELNVENGTIRRLQLGQTRKGPILLLLFVALTLGLVLVAGWEGVLGLVCSLATLAGVLFVFFPLVLSRPVILSAGVALCLLTILVTVPLVLKLSRSLWPAVLSLITVTLILFGVSEWGMGFLQLEPDETRHSRLIMTYLNRAPGVSVTSLRPFLVVGIVLGTLGAMMDVAVVISSTVYEIMRDQNKPTLRDGFDSGMRVGREILSTMINTLIFAYTGVLLPLLMAFHVFNLSWLHFLNHSFVGVEILRINVGLLGLSLIIPTTALLSAWWFRR